MKYNKKIKTEEFFLFKNTSGSSEQFHLRNVISILKYSFACLEGSCILANYIFQLILCKASYAM